MLSLADLWIACSRLKPTPMIRLQPSETMDSTLGASPCRALDSVSVDLEYPACSGHPSPVLLYADSLKTKQFQPPASTAHALKDGVLGLVRAAGGSTSATSSQRARLTKADAASS